MTLAQRLSVFFLAVLAAVLALLCAGVLLAAHVYLTRQTNHALTAGLNTIVAAIEVVPEGVEWEPAERNLSLERGPLGQEISWVLVDKDGHQIDGAFGQAGRERLLSAAEEYPLDVEQAEPRVLDRSGWRLAQQWLTPARLHPELPYHPDQDPKHEALGVTAAIATYPIGSAVRTLAIGLVATSVVLWLGALVAGQRIARRILSPISRLAHVASRLDSGNLVERVAPPCTGDELERLALTFNDLIDRLQESFERQRRFTGDAAHQLRTPLTAMRGQLEIALRRDRSAEEYRSLLDKLQAQVLHLGNIVESLLFLARADDDTRLRQLQIVELASWLASHLAEWQWRHGEAEIQSCIADGEYRAAVQPVLLGELVNILLDNASKYRDSGTPIVVRLEPLEARAALHVENLAAALDPHDVADFFEPFHRGKHGRRLGIDGLGLGLTIARRLAETFGGKILVDTAGGRIRFTVELPLSTRTDSATPPVMPETARVS